MRYQYLLIDNDNTLMDFSAAEAKALRETLQKADLPTDEATVETYSRINDALWKALERGETTQPELKVERFRQLLTHLHREGDPAALVPPTQRIWATMPTCCPALRTSCGLCTGG